MSERPTKRPRRGARRGGKSSGGGASAASGAGATTRPRRRRKGPAAEEPEALEAPEVDDAFDALTVSAEQILASAELLETDDLLFDDDDEAEPALEAAPRRPDDPVAAAARRLGIARLYPEQEQVIDEVQSGRDVLLVLPTGFGKSACYQVPSMILPKPVVVVSPLLALLEDQHRKLLARDVRCARLDGSVRGRARKQALADIAAGGPLLVMTTPETLANPELREALSGPGVGMVAVDEAHCISEWGYDFRPAYRRLGARLRDLGSPPVLALTATATPRVREAIVRTLGMREPAVIASSPHRSNLAFEVLPCEGDVRLRALLRLARRLHRPGIVYCATRREVELIHMLLTRFGIPAHRYHGGMTAKERETEQERFMEPGRRTVMAATSAFGLGIDKPDIRYVLHFQAPASLEQYVQEAGRGGRDGRKSNCILLYDHTDRAIHEALLSRSRVRPDQLYRLAAALAAWADEEREPSLEALAVSAEMGPRITAALLTKLEEAGLVDWDDKDGIRVSGSKETFEQDARALAGQFETLRTEDGHRLDALGEYALSDGCRAVYLRQYFGEPEGAPCGLCDVCRGRPARPEGFFAPLVPPREARGRRTRRAGGAQSARGGRRRGGRRRGGAGRDGERRRPRPSRAEPAPPAEARAARPASPARSESAETAPGGEPGGGQRRRRRGRRGGRRRRGRGRSGGGGGEGGGG